MDGPGAVLHVISRLGSGDEFEHVIDLQAMVMTSVLTGEVRQVRR